MIGDRLKKIREKKGLNQGEFAAFLGVSQQNLSHYENNKRDISETVKIKLQQNGVNLNWLLTGTGEPFLNGDSEPDKPAILQELENTALNATASKFADYDERLNAIEQEQQKLRQEWEEIIQLYSPENMKKPENPRKSIIRTMGSTGEVHERLAYYGADGEEEETEDLPLAENLAAGFPIEAFNEYETYPVPKRFLKKRHKYCVAKIKGTSMTAAGIADGSHVLLEYCNSPVNGSIMVVKLKEGDWEAKAKFIAVL
ncbi:helix-turn-helix domain-containing protein [Treponema phagedenis]|uniref:helix-turn-helix domain-containing protein n=1 Tax=Treponema phagedenis TaxID=162 RepID=UPI001583095D|nr:helix-turn-helix domain-containing protein [Treponema phagedenis]QKS93302.1 helix-turn-helix domain-containing protein [Treponema phagedenis]